jgi:4-hydroxy-tetrahydrodipicolinate reductase
MNIALLGYGRMGKLVEQAARREGINVALVLDSKNITEGMTKESFSGVDVCLDFTSPHVVVENIRRVAELGVNLVVGTTGWDDRITEVREIVAAHKFGFVYGPNFSVGMNLFFRLVETAAQSLALCRGYDPFIHEAHHKFKKDAPSGTALTLRGLLERFYVDRTVPVSSTRAGHVPGTHTVGFDSEADTITLTHEARNRQGFAEGAILAAKWVIGKEGFYEFREVFPEIMVDLSEQ